MNEKALERLVHAVRSGNQSAALEELKVLIKDNHNKPLLTPYIIKISVDPSLITEIGDNYHLTLSTIYKTISDAGFYATIIEGDVIETRPTKGYVSDYMDVIKKLYSLYPELQKKAILFTSFEQWTPVAVSFFTECIIAPHHDTHEAEWRGVNECTHIEK